MWVLLKEMWKTRINQFGSTSCVSEREIRKIKEEQKAL